MGSYFARLGSCLFAILLLAGCATSYPYRTRLVEAGAVLCPFASADRLARCARVTPETGQGYELHFVEFDDQVMKRLDTLLADPDQYLNIILYMSAGTIEKSGKAHPRKVIGIYVGWRVKSWDLPGYLINMSFWSRKAAALRVSHGSVQELFARLRSVQQYGNTSVQAHD